MKKRKGLSIRHRGMLTGLFFISPWLIGFVYFFVKSMAQAVIYSFNQLQILEEGGYALVPMGMRNYVNAVLENATFNRELVNSLWTMLYGVPMIIFFSLFMALLLNRKFKFRALTRAIFFLPVIMASPAIVGALAQVLLMMMGGVSLTSPEFERAQSDFNPMALAYLLVNFGMPIPIIEYIIEAIAQLYETIRASGVQILIFLAALQDVPKELYEAVEIDGGRRICKTWNITLPFISPVIFFNIVMALIGSFQTFALPFVMTGGGPNYATYFIGMHLYYEGFTASRYGYASALAILVFVILTTFSVWLFKSSKFWVMGASE